MDISHLKKSALLYAGTASLIIILTSFRVRGMWMLQDFGNILWLFCIGFTVGWLCKLPKWLRVLLLICGLGIVFSTPQQPITDIFSCQLTWHMLGYMLLGAAVPNQIDNSRLKLSETMVLSALFTFIYIACLYLSQRAHTAVYECPGDMVDNLNSGLYYLTFFPLLGFLYCFIQFAVKEEVQSLIGNKVMWWGLAFICIAALVICAFNAFGRHRWIEFLLCPAVGGLVIMGVLKLMSRKEQCNQ